ncbi:MAG: hypothetical protein HYZ53_24590 [Planctomycetes bacterium]|nr:hypothetical protein [Planctomycetota bacterium]
MNVRRGAGFALVLVGLSVTAALLLPPRAAAQGSATAPEVVPLILVHGHGADPGVWSGFLERYGPGRVAVHELFPAEADKLRPGSLPKACVIAAGYYKETITGVKFDPDANGRGQGSIGGCPVPRDDGNAARYPISYAKRLARIVEGVRRATGSDRVDLALHSMGNLVGRAYTRWFSVGGGGHSKVRRLLCVAGPHRGINALEAMIDGLEHQGDRSFMAMAECAEMCYEYKGWSGESFLYHLNKDWDTFCRSCDVNYVGISATGAKGKQVDPDDPTDKDAPSLFGFKLAGPPKHIFTALRNIRGETWRDAKPFFVLWGPHMIREFKEALGPGDGTVRFASSRMDQEPLTRAWTWATFEARHADEWNPEQSVQGSTFTTELARQFLFVGRIARGGHVDKCELRAVNAPGKGSWLVLETAVSGAPMVSAQVVEERLLNDSGAAGPATSYGFAVPMGEQRAFLPTDGGGGKRRYRVVVYGPTGPVTTQDAVVLDLVRGAPETAPFTTLRESPPSRGATDRLDHPKDEPATAAGAASDGGARGPVLHVTAESNVPAGDPTLRFSFRFDDGNWTAFASKATFVTPALAPGEHRLEARARHGGNGAHLVCDDARGAAMGILVGADGHVKVR